MRSADDSIPTDKRNSESKTPRASRSSFGIAPWVIDAGWLISDSTPPRLSANEKSFVAIAIARARLAPPLGTNETIPPKPRI